ncbi:MAG TPA: FAD-binding oxidoreductase, partial [Gemmatimonadaceae bacterium]
MDPVGPVHTYRVDVAARSVYSEGAGIARTVPRAVAVASDGQEVVDLVRWAHERGLPLVPRGSGSGMAGGAVGAGVIVDLSRLNDIGQVDVARSRVLVGAGALRDSVDSAARAVGLRFPVDPSSGRFCTVGGMASTNAAGPHTLRYGATRAWVTALDCVFDDGTRAMVRRGVAPDSEVPAIRRFLDGPSEAILAAPQSLLAHAGVRKESSGYALAAYARSGELVDLLVGSEGTLAIIVRVELALVPVPGATSSVLAEFATLEAAVEGASRARELGAAACELLDRTFLDVAARGDANTGIAPDTEAVLLAEVEGENEDGASTAALALEAAFIASGATAVRLAMDPATEHELWSIRHAASPILARLDPALRSMQFIEDGAVPPERLPEYVRGVREALATHGLRGVIFGHAGDAHAHVNPLIDVDMPDWRDRVARLMDDVVALTARLGGTLAGEH